MRWLTLEWGAAQPYQTDDGRARAHKTRPHKLSSQIVLHARSTPDSGEYPTKGFTKEDTMKLTINPYRVMHVA